LEDAYIQELGPDEGRKQFQRFANSIAAVTSGSNPKQNLLMATYLNYLNTVGKEFRKKPTKFLPVGAQRVIPNFKCKGR